MQWLGLAFVYSVKAGLLWKSDVGSNPGQIRFLPNFLLPLTLFISLCCEKASFGAVGSGSGFPFLYSDWLFDQSSRAKMCFRFDQKGFKKWRKWPQKNHILDLFGKISSFSCWRFRSLNTTLLVIQRCIGNCLWRRKFLSFASETASENFGAFWRHYLVRVQYSPKVQI